MNKAISIWGVNFNADWTVKLIFVIVQLVGFVGILSTAWHDYFVSISAVNLIFTLVVLLYFHQTNARTEWVWMIGVGILGFAVEVLGVKTGFPFGEYWYEENLGLQVFEVPLVLSVNWLLLSYTCVRFAASIIQNKFLASIFSALCMVALDFLIEPVAIAFDYWHWDDTNIPISNFVAWFCISLIFNTVWFFFVPKKGVNPFSNYVLLYLAIFFTVMRIVFA